MFCSNCGINLDDGVKFCSNCGNPVKMSPQPQEKSENLGEVKPVRVAKVKKDKSKKLAGGKVIKIVIAIVIVVVLAITAIFGINQINRITEKKASEAKWHAIARLCKEAGELMTEKDLNIYYSFDYYDQYNILIASFSSADLGIDVTSATNYKAPSGKVLVQIGSQTYNPSSNKCAQDAVKYVASNYSDSIIHGTAKYSVGFYYRDSEYVEMKLMTEDKVQDAIQRAYESLVEPEKYEDNSCNYLVGCLKDEYDGDKTYTTFMETISKYIKEHREFNETGSYFNNSDSNGEGWTYNTRILSGVEGYVIDPKNYVVMVSGENSVGNTLTWYFELTGYGDVLSVKNKPSGVYWFGRSDVPKKNKDISNSTLGTVEYK